MCCSIQIRADSLSWGRLQANWIFPSTLQDFFLGKNLLKRGGNPVAQAIGSAVVQELNMVIMDVSVTEANLNNASFQWVCNLATHCSVFVQLCLGKCISLVELRAASSQ